jgi:hypothetical protein
MDHWTYCRCGHEAKAHEHLWPGDDCGACRCRRFDGVSRHDVSPSARLAALLVAAFAPSQPTGRSRP